MPKQKLKAGLLSTLFVVLPEVEPGWERTGHQWSFIISKNNGGEIYGFWTSYCGAKSGIDPNDPRKKGVLQRWYKAVSPLLKVIMERVAI
jgi:hypothetical protein